ncbi:MAG: hypothetical protein V3U78_07925 [Thiotrichaceae bacterium]
MNYKHLFKTLLIGFIIFAVAVTLGIKYNWVKYLQTSSENEIAVEPAGLPQQDEPQSSESIPPSKTKVDNFELVDESAINGSAEDIRNDCIRASRRAGVTDENIFAVVNQCVEMSQKDVGETSDVTPIESNETVEIPENEVSTVSEGLELTRKACKIVAAEEQGLSPEERSKVIEQCVKANMDAQ